MVNCTIYAQWGTGDVQLMKQLQKSPTTAAQTQPGSELDSAIHGAGHLAPPPSGHVCRRGGGGWTRWMASHKPRAEIDDEGLYYKYVVWW
jgi:hypothetical protein